MKHLLLVLTLALSFGAIGQPADELPLTPPQADTTLIKDVSHSDGLWEVHDGTADVDGDSSATGNDAKRAWQKSCEKWQKEFRADNKENKVVSVSCGTPVCSGDAGNKTCTSKATYKIKSKVH